jgi:MFS family permease
VRTTLRPVAASFIVFGFYAGAWAVATVDIKRTFDLTDAQLGFLLGGGIIAATAVGAFGGAIADKFGARRVLERSLFIWGALVIVEAMSPTIGMFAPVLVCALAASGLVDVVMNVIAADAFSNEPGRLVRFHGLFNGGSVLGAAATGLVVHFDASWRWVWFAVGIFAIATGWITRRVPVPEPARVEHESMWRAVVELRHEGLVVLALVFGAAAMVESGIATWGVLYLREELGVGVLAGVGAYVVGQILATTTRFGGSGLVNALGTRRSIALSGTLAGIGLGAEAIAGNVAVAAGGLTLATVGISIVWPLLTAVVNSEARHPSLAIGGVTACGYLGMVLGPPIVGTLSGLFSLQVGLLVLAGLGVFVAVTPAHVRTASRVEGSGSETHA